MASIEVTETWMGDPRRDALVERVGQFVADGLALKMWRLAFTYDKQGSCVPADVFDAVPHANAFEAVRLAVRLDDGTVYIKGTRDAFAWFHDGVEQRRKAGLQSAKSRRKKFGSAVPVNATNTPQPKLEAPATIPNERRTDAEREPNETEPPYPSPSLTLKDLALSPSVLMGASPNAPTPVELDLGLIGVPPDVKKPVGFFIARYVKAYQRRYGAKARPDVRSKKIQGQIRIFVEATPLERAVQLIETYMQMDGPRGWYRDQGHDFITFINKLSAIGVALDTGRDTSKPAPLKIAEILAQQAHDEELADESA